MPPRSVLWSNIVLRTLVYYALLAGVVWLLPAISVGGLGVLGGEDPAQLLAAAPSKSEIMAAAARGQGPGALPTAIAMVAACLLTLPVCWVYVHSRRKKGYQQSVVQTMLILPVLVAGIVVLVKHSLALAFALGGIVAAVRFRTNLDDSKDAAAILAVTSIGLAAAVDPAIATVLSVGFNALMLGLWYTDFGEVPPEFEGKKAERRLERARQQAGRTGTFVAVVDEELLKAMTPAQLEALSERAWRRRKRQDPALSGSTGEMPGAYSTLLRIRAEDLDALRPKVEAVLPTVCLQWRYLGVARAEDGQRFAEWGILPQETVTPGVVSDALKTIPESGILQVEMR